MQTAHSALKRCPVVAGGEYIARSAVGYETVAAARAIGGWGPLAGSGAGPTSLTGWRGALLVAVLLLALPTTSAAAATASVFRTEGGQGSETFYYDAVSYRAEPGERNELRVSVELDGALERVVLRDAGAVVVPGEGCSSIDAQAVRCRGEFGRMRAVASLGDGSDSARLEAAALVDGGPGDDTLVGSPRRDLLEGGLGTDTVNAGDGRDSLSDTGGDGDQLDGGAGADGLDLRSRQDGARVDLGADVARSAGERDAIPRIENVTGGRGDDVLIGDRRANELRSFAGRDTLVGRGGADFLNCKSAIRRRCRLRGGDAGDLIFGSAGPDVLIGAAGEDTLAAGPGRDRLIGGRGRDLLEGGRGDDLLIARDRRRDRVDGGTGRDRGRVDRGIDRLRRLEALR